MKKSVISLILVICLLCSFVPVTAFAAEIVASGWLSLTNVTWSLDDTGLLSFSGYGPMTDCGEFINVHYDEYTDSVTAGYIQDGITDIGKSCFEKCYLMEEVYIPDSIVLIESHAFDWCRNLTSIKLPANLEAIEGFAFYNCDGLETIEFNDKLTYIGKNAFDMCRSLTEITLPASLETIDSYAFRSCENLRTVTFEGDAPEIIGDVFSGVGLFSNLICRYPADNSTWTKDVMKSYGGWVTWEAYESESGTPETPPEEEIPLIASGICGENATWALDTLNVLTISGTGPMGDYDYTNLPWKEYKNGITAVVVDEGITSVCSYCFAFCSYLTEISLSSTVTSMGQKAIYESRSLEAIHVAEGNPCYSSVDGILFNGDRTQLLKVPVEFQGAYSVPAGVTAIGDSAFSQCSNLTEVSIPEGVTTIGESAFYYCSGLHTVTLSDSLTTIGDSAFSLCYSLKELTIPKNVTSIGRMAFYDSNLEDLWFQGPQPAIGEYAFLGLQITVYYPARYESSWRYHDMYGANSIGYMSYGFVLAGDLDGDGQVNDADVAYLLWHTLFPDAFPIDNDADFDGDGQVNDADVAYLLWHTLFPDAYPL